MKTRFGVKDALVFVHRWLGVCLCLLFVMWFVSGIAMMYWDYPEVTGADRLVRETPLDAAQVKLSPQEAYAKLGALAGDDDDDPPASARLATFDGRPAYRFRGEGTEFIVFADNGDTVATCPADLTRRIASAWSGQPAAAAKEEINTEEDQWTVSGEFSELRPMRKYSWPDGQQVYVSRVTCDVVQYTTRASRLGAYFGAIPHWIYFTELRKRVDTWSRVVIWTSGLATLGAMLGLVIGVWTYSPNKRYRRGNFPTSIPYTGQKWWHMVLGLTFGLLACTWAFSGMLSMDPFPDLQHGSTDLNGADLAEALREPPALEAFAARTPRQVLEIFAPDGRPKELELASVLGQAVYFATSSAGQRVIVPVAGQPEKAFDGQAIVAALARAADPYKITETRLVTQYEAYYLDRHHELPLPVIFVQFNDAERSMFYVDPKTAEIVEAYTSHSRWNRWLYHGFHSIDLPWLYKHRPAWDITVLVLLLGGAWLSVTSLILAWRVVRGKFRGARLRAGGRLQATGGPATDGGQATDGGCADS